MAVASGRSRVFDALFASLTRVTTSTVSVRNRNTSLHTRPLTQNTIHALTRNAILANMVHVFTDCPHRERLGWQEQTYFLAPAISYNFDIASLWAK